MPELSTKIEFTARVDVDLYNRWKEKFPIYGSNVWMVEAVMEEMLKMDDITTTYIHQAIQAAAARARA